MSLHDPRYPDEGDTNDPMTVQRLSAVQLISHVHHHTRAPVTSTLGWSELLANGHFGFANSEQQELINNLRKSITTIAQAYQEMAEWLAVRVDQDGNCISDVYGTHRDRLHQAPAQPESGSLVKPLFAAYFVSAPQATLHDLPTPSRPLLNVSGSRLSPYHWGVDSSSRVLLVDPLAR